MISKLRTVLLALTALVLVQTAQAQTKLIHYWHFNNYSVANVRLNNLKANYSAIDTNKAVFSYKNVPGVVADTTGYMDNYVVTDTTGQSVNQRMNAGNGVGIRVRNPSDSMAVLCYLPSTHYKNLVVKFVTESSSASSGMLYQLFDYSVDSGATWKTTGLTRTKDTMGTGWALISIGFNDTTANNNAKLVLRVKFQGNNTGTSGNNRFDDVTLEGDTVTATTTNPTTSVTTIGSNSKFHLYPNPVSNTLHIDAVEGDKMITVFDALGKQVAQINSKEEHLAINTTSWNYGVYYVRIVSAGNSYSSTFVKQ